MVSVSVKVIPVEVKEVTLPNNVGQSGFTSGTISSLTANGMVVTNTETQSGISYVNTITFTKQ